MPGPCYSVHNAHQGASGFLRPSRCAKILLEIGDIHYRGKHDFDQALRTYDGVVGRYTGLEDGGVRLTHLRIGDIMRDRGDCARACQCYADAEKIRLVQWSASQRTTLCKNIPSPQRWPRRRPCSLELTGRVRM